MTQTVLLIAAVRAELDETIERFRLRGDATVLTGQCNGAQVVAGVTGIGAERARDAMARLCDAYQPNLIISAGLSGGLNPLLKAGDLVEPRWVVNDEQQALRLNGGVPEFESNADVREQGATLLTTRVLADSVARKRELYETHRAAVVDMETYFLAQLAAERGVALRAVRAVSDPANMALPADVLDWVDESGQTRLGVVTASLMRQPRLVPEVMRLNRYVRVASANLAQHVARMVESL